MDEIGFFIEAFHHFMIHARQIYILTAIIADKCLQTDIKG